MLQLQHKRADSGDKSRPLSQRVAALLNTQTSMNCKRQNKRPLTNSGFDKLRLRRAQASTSSGFDELRLRRAQASTSSGFDELRLRRAQASTSSGFDELRL